MIAARAAKRRLWDAVKADTAGELPWTEWQDGRPRRLKRGKHYTGDSKLVERRAREAAEGLGRFAVTSRDGAGEYEYLWIQFVEGEVDLGQPCPQCGGTGLLKVQKYFLRCSTCGSTLRVADEADAAAGEYDPLELEAAGANGDNSDASLAGGEALPKVAVARASELGEIVGVRALSPRGEEVELALAEEGLVLEVTFTTARPRLLAWVGFALTVERRKLLVSGCDDSLELMDPGTHVVTAEIPPHLLSDVTYNVKLGLTLEDPSDGSTAALLDREATSFEGRVELRERPTELGMVHPVIRWSVPPADAVRRIPSVDAVAQRPEALRI